MESRASFGAAVERGTVQAVRDGRAQVLSLSRDGVQTPFLRSLLMEPLVVGDLVYFFLFDDGDGLIIGRYEAEV